MSSSLPLGGCHGRFQYDLPGSFCQDWQRAALGAGRRAHKRVDPIIGELFRTEIRKRWRYILVSVPLAWCECVGGRMAGAPARADVRGDLRRGFSPLGPLPLLYAAPALLMLGLHAALASHYTRYNLILIGPFSAGAAWLLASIGASVRRRRREPFPEGDRNFELVATEMEKRS